MSYYSDNIVTINLSFTRTQSLYLPLTLFLIYLFYIFLSFSPFSLPSSLPLSFSSLISHLSLTLTIYFFILSLPLSIPNSPFPLLILSPPPFLISSLPLSRFLILFPFSLSSLSPTFPYILSSSLSLPPSLFLILFPFSLSSLSPTSPYILSSSPSFLIPSPYPLSYYHIDRTFPTHPYFIHKEGQEALHRVLHAYAVSDTVCGYCQGLSFVTGIVLMHVRYYLLIFNTHVPCTCTCCFIQI